MEVCLIEKTKYSGQYPGLFLFTEPARMIRPVTNLRVNKTEYVGSFEQVLTSIIIIYCYWVIFCLINLQENMSAPSSQMGFGVC